jgi:hypothetical protein
VQRGLQLLVRTRHRFDRRLQLRICGGSGLGLRCGQRVGAAVRPARFTRAVMICAASPAGLVGALSRLYRFARAHTRRRARLRVVRTRTGTHRSTRARTHRSTHAQKHARTEARTEASTHRSTHARTHPHAHAPARARTADGSGIRRAPGAPWRCLYLERHSCRSSSTWRIMRRSSCTGGGPACEGRCAWFRWYSYVTCASTSAANDA